VSASDANARAERICRLTGLRLAPSTQVILVFLPNVGIDWPTVRPVTPVGSYGVVDQTFDGPNPATVSASDGFFTLPRHFQGASRIFAGADLTVLALNKWAESGTDPKSPFQRDFVVQEINCELAHICHDYP
jgi:hypothetical protein